MCFMAFDTIVFYIVVLQVDLLYDLSFPCGIQGVAQAAEFPAGWLSNSNAVSIVGMVKARAVARLAGYTGMGVGSQIGSHIVMAFDTDRFTCIMQWVNCVFFNGKAAVMAIFPE
jgi:hypothetical protein